MFNNAALAPLVPAGIFKETESPEMVDPHGFPKIVSMQFGMSLMTIVGLLDLLLQWEIVDLSTLKVKMLLVHKKLQVGGFIMAQNLK